MSLLRILLLGLAVIIGLGTVFIGLPVLILSVAVAGPVALIGILIGIPLAVIGAIAGAVGLVGAVIGGLIQLAFGLVKIMLFVLLPIAALGYLAYRLLG